MEGGKEEEWQEEGNQPGFEERRWALLVLASSPAHPSLPPPVPASSHLLPPPLPIPKNDSELQTADPRHSWHVAWGYCPGMWPRPSALGRAAKPPGHLRQSVSAKQGTFNAPASLQILSHHRGAVTQPEPCEWNSQRVTKPFAGTLWAAWRDLRSRKCLPVVSPRTHRGGVGHLCRRRPPE